MFVSVHCLQVKRKPRSNFGGRWFFIFLVPNCSLTQRTYAEIRCWDPTGGSGWLLSMQASSPTQSNPQGWRLSILIMISSMHFRKDYKQHHFSGYCLHKDERASTDDNNFVIILTKLLHLWLPSLFPSNLFIFLFSILCRFKKLCKHEDSSKPGTALCSSSREYLW